MCVNNYDYERQIEFDESLLNLFKKFKEGNEIETDEKIDDDILKVDFVNYIQDNISKLIEEDIEVENEN